jgi:Na+-transporting NADH:ubiquinone oxidoreductase subunit NqrC
LEKVGGGEGGEGKVGFIALGLGVENRLRGSTWVGKRVVHSHTWLSLEVRAGGQESKVEFGLEGKVQ